MAASDASIAERGDPAQDHHDEKAPASPRSDFIAGLAWLAFGAVVLVASLRMDRLESQNINPVTIPGLLPALLGVGLMLLGAVLALRSHARGGLSIPAPPRTELQRESSRRVWTVIALCSAYAVGLVGHGLPFWLASAIFIVAVIVIMQRMSRDPVARTVTPRLWTQALAVGLIAAGLIHFVFQELFLVHLP